MISKVSRHLKFVGLVAALVCGMGRVFADPADEVPRALEAVRLVVFTQVEERPRDPYRNRVLTVVTIAAASTGCTQTGHFDVRLREKDGAQMLTFVRNQSDPCKATPHEELLTFTLDTLRQSNAYPIYLENPVLAAGMAFQPGDLLARP